MEDTPHPPRFRIFARTLAALFASTLAPLTPAASPATPPPPTTPPTTWQAEATAAQLTPAHIAQLARDKLLIGPQTHRQIFQPYIEAGMEKPASSRATPPSPPTTPSSKIPSANSNSAAPTNCADI